MTIYDIKHKHLLKEPNSYFFSRQTMRFFGQTLKSFSVRKYGRGYRMSAPMRDRGKYMGETERFFDPVDGSLKLNGEHLLQA